MRPVPRAFHSWIRASISSALIFALLQLAFGGRGLAKFGQFLDLRHAGPQARGLGQFVVIESAIFIGIKCGNRLGPGVGSDFHRSDRTL